MPVVSTRTLAVVYFTMLMDILNFGIVFPLLPSIAKTFDMSAIKMGAMGTAYSLFQMCAMPILGRLSDKLGRRPVLLFSLTGSMLSAWALCFAKNFPMLVAARCINGVSGATMGVVNAYIADVTTEEERPVYLSYASASNSLGIILGPAIGGLLSKHGFFAAFFASACLCTLNLLFAIPFVEESRYLVSDEGLRSLSVSSTSGEGANAEGNSPVRVPSSTTAEGGESANAEGNSPVRVPCAAGYLFSAAFFMITGFAALESVVGYYLVDEFSQFGGDVKKSAQFYGMCFAFNGMIIFFSAAFLYRPARKLLLEMPLVALGVSIRSMGFFFQGLAPSPSLFAVAMGGVVLGNQFIQPSIASTLTKMCHRSIYGRALGYNQAAQALARVVAPVAFGAGYEHISHKFSFYACAAMTMLAGGLLLKAISTTKSMRLITPVNVSNFSGVRNA